MDKIPVIIKKILSWLSKYTMGIYAIHMLIGIIIGQLNFSFKFPVYGSFSFSIIVFVCSLVVVFLISLIPVRWAKKIAT